MTRMLKEVADAIERELGVQEMVLADPLTLRRLAAERAAREVLAVIKELEAAPLELPPNSLAEYRPQGPVMNAPLSAIFPVDRWIETATAIGSKRPMYSEIETPQLWPIARVVAGPGVCLLIKGNGDVFVWRAEDRIPPYEAPQSAQTD